MMLYNAFTSDERFASEGASTIQRSVAHAVYALFKLAAQLIELGHNSNT